MTDNNNQKNINFLYELIEQKLQEKEMG